MPIPPKWVLAAAAVGSFVTPCSGQGVFINELHYDNAGADTGEFVEVAGPAGTSLAGYRLVFYNGSNGGDYRSETLSGVIPDEGEGFGARAFFVPGIQNGSPDGVALVDGGTLVQFLSYEGRFVAVGGSADGVTSEDIGVSEPTSSPAGNSLQLVGDGEVASDFTWAPPAPESPGLLNSGQRFSGEAPMPPGRIEGIGGAIRVAACNVQNGAGALGSQSFEALRRVLLRVRPDVIGFSEAEPDGDFANLRQLVTSLGLDHLATGGDLFGEAAFDEGDFGSGQAVAIASRWPIREVVQIGRGVPGRRELTRYPLFVSLDVPELPSAMDPALVAVHFKAGPTDADNFRRLIEGYRVREFLEGRGYDGNQDNLFVVGDVNEDFEDFLPASYFTGIDTATHVFSDGSTFPASYLLGADLAAPNGQSLPYRGFPRPAFSPVGLEIIDASQLDGAVRTFNVAGNARLDYLIASRALSANAPPFAEVYNSSLEFGYDGLPKAEPIPFGNDSFTGSDHHVVFGDFALQPLPQVQLGLSSGQFDDAMPVPITATVSLSPAAAGPVELELSVASGRFLVPDTITVPAGGSASFALSPACPGGAAPDAEVRVSASAPGVMADHVFVHARNREASGVLLFSGYVEPPSGGSPKAVEVVNNSGAEIDFADTPMRLLLGLNGAVPDTAELVLREGKLPAGAVVVVGGEATGNYLVGEGLLADPGESFSTFEEGTPFLAGDGRVVFVKRTLFFNGDDALALQLSFVLTDTFGTVGQDPGAAWASGGVSTANQLLTLRDDVATGSQGWEDPSRRWVSLGEGNSLAGIGVPPRLDDPYRAWAASNGLSGAAAGTSEDADKDGLTNLMNFATGGERPQVVVAEGSFLALEFLRRADPGRLIYAIEVSADMVSWLRVEGDEYSVDLAPDGYERVVLGLDSPIAGEERRYLRLSVHLP